MRDVWCSNRRSVFVTDYIQEDGTTVANNPNPNLQSMDTIFVKEVRHDGPAYAAGLRQGDQILTVNDQPINGKTYSQVIAMIQNAFVYLSLDILQRIILTFLFFSSPADLVLNVLPKDDENRILVNIFSYSFMIVFLFFFFAYQRILQKIFIKILIQMNLD